MDIILDDESSTRTIDTRFALSHLDDIIAYEYRRMYNLCLWEYA